MAEDRKQVALRLRRPLLVAVDEAALASGLDRHAWLVAAIERGLDGPVGQDIGPVERDVTRDLEALVTSHPMGEALAAGAVHLARALDKGAGMATAGIWREIRATLNDLASHAEGSVDDDDAPDLGAPTLGDTEDEDSPDAW